MKAPKPTLAALRVFKIWGLDFSSTQYGLQQMATTWITETAQAQGRTLTLTAFRIVAPRQFILSATFDL